MPKSMLQKGEKNSHESGVRAITEKEESEKKKFEAIESDIKDMKHNIRNRLTAALYNLEDAKDNVSDFADSETQKSLQIVCESLKGACEILKMPIPALEEALDRIPLKLEAVQVADVINQVTNEFSGKTRVTKQLYAPNARALADKGHLSQVLYNLFENAVKYNPYPDKMVRVAVIGLKTRVNIVIEDNGMGFKESDLDKVFESEYRSDSSAHIKGSGIGLHYCKKVITQFGGHIDADNCLHRKGAVISIELIKA